MADNNEPTNLDLITLDDILSELQKRYTGFIFVVECPTKNCPSESDTSFFWHGGINKAVGLCERFKSKLLTEGDKIINGR